MVHITKQACISEQGKRANNEDTALFSEGKVFVVCDGVGGNEKGEVASHIVAEVFLECGIESPMPDLNQVLKLAETQLDEHLAQNPETAGMATTLTFSMPTPHGILVAWCGDSRVYQFREGRIIFQTRDHSWVNEAVENGIITAEEAVNHPKSNVITRAIQGSHKSTQLDITLLTDVQKGDFFLHCSDGVLEAWSDTDLEALFNSNGDVDELASVLKQQCEIDSRDNFTAIIYAIESSEIQPELMVPVKPLEEQVYVAAIPIDKLPDPDDNTLAFKAEKASNRLATETNARKEKYTAGNLKNKSTKGFNWKAYGIALIIPLLLYGVYTLFFNEKTDKPKQEQPQDRDSTSKKDKKKGIPKVKEVIKNEDIQGIDEKVKVKPEERVAEVESNPAEGEKESTPDKQDDNSKTKKVDKPSKPKGESN
jgi:serine/threonine protein phosphatase PrpC